MLLDLSFMLIANWEFAADVDYSPHDLLLSYKRMTCKCDCPLVHFCVAACHDCLAMHPGALLDVQSPLPCE